MTQRYTQCIIFFIPLVTDETFQYQIKLLITKELNSSYHYFPKYIRELQQVI